MIPRRKTFRRGVFFSEAPFWKEKGTKDHYTARVFAKIR